MKWVCTRPLVLEPQTKKVANSTQKIGTRTQSCSTIKGDISSEPSPMPAGGGGDTAVSP